MAQGRMIVNAICMDKRINDLSCDTSRLAFTWLITFADCEGRTYGDPAVVRSMLFPRRDDITLADMTAYMHEWHNAGLIVWYEIKGDKFVWFPAFEKNQVGLRKDRESASRIPQLPQSASSKETETIRSNSGVTPAQVKAIEVNVNKEKEIEESPAIPEPTVWQSDPTIDPPAPAAPAPYIHPTRKAESLILKCGRMAAVPSKELPRVEQVLSMIDKYGEGQVERALTEAFRKWVNTPRKSGGGNYSPLNFGWVDWAQEALMNVQADIKPAYHPNMSKEELMRYLGVTPE